MTDIADLITRLEGAIEGSRELDALIAIGANLVPPYEFGLAEGYDYAYDIVEDRGETFVRRLPRHIATETLSPEFSHGRHKPPAYTTSVDAALTLLRPDDWLKLNHRWVDEKFGGTRECFAGIEYSEAPFFSGGRLATFPLAICLAALRSRQSATVPLQHLPPAKASGFSG